MSHLLKLAEEYNVEGVLDLCVKCLKDRVSGILFILKTRIISVSLGNSLPSTFRITNNWEICLL